MTLTAARSSTLSAGSPHAVSRGPLDRTLVVIGIGLFLSAAMSWPRVIVVWQDNTFFDTDDAMRLVQVRAWLAGQGWFDLVAHRLDPPSGLLMHWSRIVDVPVAALIRLIGPFTDADTSERMARIAFPLILQGALVALAVAIGPMLAGPRALLPSMMLIVLSGFTFEQFPAGRIDHHAPQITLLLGMAAALVSALGPGRGRHAAIVGLCLPLSLSISLENLPFLVVIVAALPLVWVIEGRAMRTAMFSAAGSLAVFAPALFAATVPPERYGVVAGDAFSLAHLVGILAGAAGLALLATLSDRLSTITFRAAALGMVAAGVASLLMMTFPDCLHDPYATMDPVLKRIWLSHVTEAQPLLDASRLRPDTMTILGCPLFAGAIALALAAAFERGVARLRWLTILGLTLVGIAGTFWEIRVAASVQPLAALGGVWVVTRLLERSERHGSVPSGILAIILVAPFSALVWATVPTGEGDKVAAAALAQGQACRLAPALAPLAALSPGLVFAPIDDGSHLLVATPHTVVAAPYHRNQEGNRRVVDGFLASPAAAETIVRRSGARYVALCPGEIGITTLASAAPEGLAARLVAGETPPWLRPIDVGASPYKVYAVGPASAEAITPR